VRGIITPSHRMKVCDSKIPMTFPYVTSMIALKAHAIFTIPNETEGVNEIGKKRNYLNNNLGKSY